MWQLEEISPTFLSQLLDQWLLDIFFGSDTHIQNEKLVTHLDIQTINIFQIICFLEKNLPKTKN